MIVSRQTFQRFILGRQGLYPGRRWQGQAGVRQSIQQTGSLQLDPLVMIARQHDLALHSRVIDYQPDQLMAEAYQERQFFDYGGALFMYPMQELPYWRLIMDRYDARPNHREHRRTHLEVYEQVRQALRERGPLGNRDFEGNQRVNSYRGRKDTGVTMFRMWLAGELMTHNRRKFERVYDFLEKVAPPDLHHAVSEAESEQFFARKAMIEGGMTTGRGWRNRFAGFVERKVTPAEAGEWLDRLVKAGQFKMVEVETFKDPFYLLSEDFPLLEMLHTGEIPAEWKPLDTTTDQEATFLAPLENVSARGRAKILFDFEYIWEVYKPVEQRKWGYYVLPVLYQDRLVARFDSKLDRKTMTYHILNFFLETDMSPDDSDFAAAVGRGFKRMQRFLEAKQIDFSGIQAKKLRKEIEKML